MGCCRSDRYMASIGKSVFTAPGTGDQSMLQKFKKIDFVIVFVLLMLMVVSITSIYSATLDTIGFENTISRWRYFISSDSQPFRTQLD